jgi:hypothetical protein
MFTTADTRDGVVSSFSKLADESLVYEVSVNTTTIDRFVEEYRYPPAAATTATTSKHSAEVGAKSGVGSIQKATVGKVEVVPKQNTTIGRIDLLKIDTEGQVG